MAHAAMAVFSLDFPKYLVLELGVSDPGDMKYLLSMIKPEISVITDITQRYLESFGDMDSLAGEYEFLVKRTRSFVLLNYDNPRIRGMALNKTRNRKSETENKYSVFFGFGDGADWQSVEAKKREYGQKVKVCRNGVVNEYRIKRFGKHHVYALMVGLMTEENILSWVNINIRG